MKSIVCWLEDGFGPAPTAGCFKFPTCRMTLKDS